MTEEEDEKEEDDDEKIGKLRVRKYFVQIRHYAGTKQVMQPKFRLMLALELDY